MIYLWNTKSKMLFFQMGGKLKYPQKTTSEEGEKHRTQPTYYHPACIRSSLDHFFSKVTLDFYILCHLWWRAEQQSLQLFWHNCDVSPFSVEQSARQTGHHGLWKRFNNRSTSCLRFQMVNLMWLMDKSIFIRFLRQIYWPCFFGRSTVNLWRTSLVFPQSVPNSAPLPSITMNPNLLSSARRAFRA